jgi:CLIP-associating protein 1/2
VRESPDSSPAKPSPKVVTTLEPEASQAEGSATPTPTPTPSKSLRVYEDPFTEDQDTPRPVSNGSVERPVLEDKPVNEDAANLARVAKEAASSPTEATLSPEKTRQNMRLLESGITRVRAKTLDVHGFRKLQSLVRDNKSLFTDDKLDNLVVGLFEYLESPLENVAPEKVQDVKAQILATIKLLLKKHRDNFQPHISRGLEALLNTRACYDARTHIVSGLELLADELVAIGDPAEMTVSMTRDLAKMDILEARGARSLSMGLHILRSLIDGRPAFVPSDSEVTGLASLASRCLESKESGVRMDAVQLCVALHARVGEARFWDNMRGVKDDPKSLITYYVVKRQRETEDAGAV